MPCRWPKHLPSGLSVLLRDIRNRWSDHQLSFITIHPCFLRCCGLFGSRGIGCYFRAGVLYNIDGRMGISEGPVHSS